MKIIKTAGVAVLFIISQILIFAGAWFYDLKILEFGGRNAETNLILVYISIVLAYFTIKMEIAGFELEDIEKEFGKVAVSQGRLLSEVEKATDRMEKIIPNAKALSQDEFYEDFAKRAGNARKTVDIAHLDTESPLNYALDNTVTGKYYHDRFIDLVKSHPNIEFRRVERGVDSKKTWIQFLVKNLVGCKNFSLVCLEPDPGGQRLPHISVQIVDDERAYLVAVAQHKAQHGPRDIVLFGHETVAIWQSYYDNILWNKSKKIMERGAIV